MRVLVKINLESTIDKYINKCDGLILGISHFSVGFKDTFELPFTLNSDGTYHTDTINKSDYFTIVGIE